MVSLSTLLSLLALPILGGVAYYPGYVEAQAEQAILEAARPQLAGDNGAKALYALDAAFQWPESVPRCARDEDCVATARKNVVAYRALPPDARAALAARGEVVQDLRQFDFFQYSTAFDEQIPPLVRISDALLINVYRYADGETEAALAGSCAMMQVGRTLLFSRNSLIDSMIGAQAVTRSTELFADIRAAHPNMALPPVCDAVQVLPDEALALCPLLYQEWYVLQTGTQSPPEEFSKNVWVNRVLTHLYGAWVAQVRADAADKYSRNCAPDVLAAVAHDEVRLADSTAQDDGKYCSPLNVLCKISSPDFQVYQARILNAQRILTAFVALRDGQDGVPSYIERGKGQWTVHLHPAEGYSEQMILPVVKK